VSEILWRWVMDPTCQRKVTAHAHHPNRGNWTLCGRPMVRLGPPPRDLQACKACLRLLRRLNVPLHAIARWTEAPEAPEEGETICRLGAP
jgi:hypothetical protein